MTESPVPDDGVSDSGEETVLSSPNEEPHAVIPRQHGTSLYAPGLVQGDVGISVQIPSINLNKGSFDRPNFGPQKNIHHIEANQIEHAVITHHHHYHHYHNQGADVSDGDETTTTNGAKQSSETDNDGDIAEGYIQICDDVYMYTKKSLKNETRVYDGFLKHVSGDKQSIVVKKIAPCDKKSIREVQHLVSLAPHQNVVQIFRSKQHKSLTHLELYIAMERCRLQNLHDFLKQNRDSNKPFDLKQTMSYAKQLVNGMKHIHSNRIIHRDLKPENVLFSIDGEQIKIADFGISKRLRGSKSKTKLTSQGTDGFRAPETFQPGCDVSMKSDIYSLGVTLYSLFTNGKHPFGEDSHLQIYNMKHNIGLDLSGLPDEMGPMKLDFMDLLKRMLEFEPNSRPTIEEVLEHRFFLDCLGSSCTDSSSDIVEEMSSAEAQGIQESVVMQSNRSKEVKSRTCLWLLLSAVLTAFIGIYLNATWNVAPQSLSDIVAGHGTFTLHITSKSHKDTDGDSYLQAEVSIPGGQVVARSNVLTDGNVAEARRKLEKITRQSYYPKWMVAVFFEDLSNASNSIVNNMHQGYHLCHRCSPLKGLQTKSFRLNIMHDHLRVVELIDIMPASEELFKLSSKSFWAGIIFWFDNETLQFFAVNLGHFEVNFNWNLGNCGDLSRQPLPLGLPISILPIGKYKDFELDGNAKPFLWTKVMIQLGEHADSEVKVAFYL